MYLPKATLKVLNVSSDPKRKKTHKTNGIFFHIGFIALSLLQDLTKQGFVMYPF
jgi:hypothetical protein